MHPAVTKPIFIVGLVTIAKYCMILEPNVNVLQSKNMDLIVVVKFIGKIQDIIKKDQQDTKHFWWIK